MDHKYIIIAPRTVHRFMLDRVAIQVTIYMANGVCLRLMGDWRRWRVLRAAGVFWAAGGFSSEAGRRGRGVGKKIGPIFGVPPLRRSNCVAGINAGWAGVKTARC